MKIEIKNRFTLKIILEGEYESVKDCLKKNRGADLRGADLSGADLRDAYLGGADLRGTKNYMNSHDVCLELIRRQKINFFTSIEWEIIGKMAVHRFCWDDIKKMFGETITPIFKKLSDLGWNEWFNYYNLAAGWDNEN